MDKILETESQRIYKSSNDNERMKEIKKNSFEVEYKGEKFNLVGFKTFKQDDKIIFAYKIKLIDTTTGVFLYFIPNESNINSYIHKLLNDKKEEGFEVINMAEEFDKALLQKNSIKKWKK